ncbi:hypothetical protein EPJ78_02185 [Brachyspira aalborgi]|uniref:Uncharacterized protein n=1 Tax=Brachyspira aalborgi TaxID=29522 RepID=A0A5C8EJD2_9SPIR|nr:hypothetical protein EPJ78_02185 [Brachyspira aalborgi]
MYSNIFSSEIRQQNRTEQNRTEQNRTEQNRTEQNRTEQNPYRASFGRRTELLQNLFYCKRKSCKVYFSRLIGLLLIIRNKILSLIILKFFMQFSKFLNAHPSGHKARGGCVFVLIKYGF